MVTVSVLMGSYNHEKYIGQAIESVLNQTFADLELIIVDDCSRDQSREIIEKYQSKDSRVRAFFHEKNMGISQSVNDALRTAKGKFISFIGSDDMWFPYKLERQLDLIKSHEDMILWSEGEIIDGNGNPTGVTFTQMHHAQNKKKTGNLFKEIVNDNYIFGQSLLIKRDFAENFSFDLKLKYLGDYSFMVDLASEHDFYFSPEPMAKYRIHGENSISKNPDDWLTDLIHLENYILQKYSGRISNNLKGILYLKIGKTYSDLNCKTLAKRFYLKAFMNDFRSKEVFLYLTYVLTDAEGWFGNFLLSTYFKVNSVFAQSA